VALLPRFGTGNDRPELWPYRQHCVHRRQRGQSQCAGLLRVESRTYCADQIARQGGRVIRHFRQLHYAGRSEDRDFRSDDARAHRLHALENPPRTLRDRGGNRQSGRVLRVERLLVHHRRGLRYFRWAGDLLSDPLQQRRQRLTGIALMCGAVATFSCLDATGKYLLRYMDPLQVVWARYFGAFLLALIFLNPITRPKMMTTTRPFMQLGRSTLLLISTA